MTVEPETQNAFPDIDDMRRGIGQILTHLQRIGVSHLPIPNAAAAKQWTTQWSTTEPNEVVAAAESKTIQPMTSATPSPTKPAPKVKTAPPTTTRQQRPATISKTYKSPALPIADRQASLDRLRAQVSQCTLCHELACTRTQTVFGEGNPAARVCFFGEAPGADEDRQGLPFVGRAGQLLTKIIEATKLKREEVYIFNTLKCRPPSNRNPLPEELVNCRTFYEAQLELIQPEYIVCLGLFAAQSLLKVNEPIGRMRGRFHSYQGSKVIVTYHPAYLLRNEKMKGAAWQDMQMMMRDMGTLPT